MKRLYLILAVFLQTFCMAASVHAATLKITELAVTTRVLKGKPIDSVHRISYQSIKNIYCFTRTVLTDADETVIKHLWIQDGQVLKETELPIKGKNWRVYSTMPIGASSRGNWQVEVKDETGAVLRKIEFRIQ